MEKTRTMKTLPTWIAAMALCAVTAGAAAHDHDHDHGGGAPAELALDNGKKWPTDAALRQGMARIRAAVAQGAPLAPAQVAAQVNGQIAYLVNNCKLDQKTDAMFHLVLADLIAGADILDKRPAAREEGMARINKALRDYAGHFEHPGW